jgi:hypothetical protein
MKKGTQAKAVQVKPVEGKKDTSKPTGGKVFFGFAGKAKMGKKAK